MALTKDAAVKNAFGSALFLPMKKITASDIALYGNGIGEEGGMMVAIDALGAATNGMIYYTGKIYKDKIIQITSSYTVATEGTLTGSLETTNYGPTTKAFLSQYAPMFYSENKRAAAATTEMEELTDEWGWKGGGAAEASVPVDKMLLGLFWGGTFENQNNVHYLKVGLCSIGNETVTSSFQNGQWMRRTFTLTGHYPSNDIILEFNNLRSICESEDINIGLIPVNLLHEASGNIILPKDVQVDEYFVEVQYRDDE